MLIPAALAANCVDARSRAWLENLPSLLEDVARRWRLEVGEPFEGPDVSASWVAVCTRSDGAPAVLKLPLPHLEGEHEVDGLRIWDGEPTVRLLEADDATGAMLLERCIPGTTLRSLPEPDQDVVVAELLHELWREPPAETRFRPLEVMIHAWADEIRAEEATWPDRGLVAAALETYEELLASPPERAVVLATDLHAGNVLRAERRPWLVIDPKPFVGERAYDVTQHLVNCERRMPAEPLETIDRVADLTGVDADRVRRWMFARAAAERREGADVDWLDVARRLAP